VAWSLVQVGHGSNNANGNSYTVTMPGNFTAGNLVVSMSTWGTANSAALTSVAVGATTGVIKNPTTDTPDTQSFAMGYVLNNPGGTATYNVNGTAGSIGLDSLTIVAEYTNTGVSSATFDTSAARVGTLGAGGSIALGSSIGAAGDLIVGFIIEDSNPGSLAAGTGWVQDLLDSADPNFFGLSASIISQKGAAGAANPTWTAGASGSFLIGGLSFTIPGGGTTLTLGQKAWDWNGQAPTLSFNNALAQQAWHWGAQAPTLTFDIAMAQRAWAWAANAAGLQSSIALAQKPWNWAGNGIVFAGTTTVALAQQAWRWAAASFPIGGNPMSWRSRRGQPGTTNRGGPGSGGKIGQ